MADLDLPNQVVEAIYAAWKKQGDAEPGRRYLGASVAGHECDRYLWLHFRGVGDNTWEGRMYRLFHRGAREEAVFCMELRNIGCKVWECDPETGLQFGVEAFGGHFGGHLDGIATGVPGAEKTVHVLEFKTHNDASFRKLQKDGVEAAKPMHYVQMQCYMGLMRLDRALYLAVDKDNDELYAERVAFDRDKARAVMIRVKRIIESNDAPKCAARETDYRCKLCGYARQCWGSSISNVAHIDCRSCCRATPVTTGTGAVWTCELGHECGPDKICDRHILLPSLVNAELLDAGEDWIRYRSNGIEFINGAGGFRSSELPHLTPAILANPAVNEARNLFDGTITGVTR